MVNLEDFKMLPDGSMNIEYLFVKNGLVVNGKEQYKIATIEDLKICKAQWEQLGIEKYLGYDEVVK